MNRRPVPLVPWEEFFYYKHRPSHPATFYAYFEFSQSLDRKLADEALRLVCQRHLLTRAIVQPLRGRLVWQPVPRPQFQWCSQPVRLEDLPDGQLDIRREPGLKIWAYAGQPKRTEPQDAGSPMSEPDRVEPQVNLSVGDSRAKHGSGALPASNLKLPPASMQVVIHHVAFDGLGVLQVLLDWLGEYQRLQGAGSDDCIASFAERSLARRCRPSGGLWQAVRLLPGQWKSILASWHLLGRRAIPLGIGPAVPASQIRPPQVARLQFDRATTLQLKRMAAAQSATLNSLLIRSLLRAIDQWQGQWPRPPAGTHLRIMIPIDQRQREHRDAAACNHCSMVHLDRTRDEVADPVSLLASIEQEMGVIQRWKLSLNFWRALALFRWLPGGLARFQSSEVAATASLTNLSRLRLNSAWATQAADPPDSRHPLRLLDFEIVAPLLHGTMAAFAVAYWQGELKLTLHYDSHHLTAAQAEHLLKVLQHELLGKEPDATP